MVHLSMGKISWSSKSPEHSCLMIKFQDSSGTLGLMFEGSMEVDTGKQKLNPDIMDFD